GVYALFLKAGSNLPGIQAGPGGLLYIGKAANRAGLAGRCHFSGRTRNHSPRKSLAVLLREQLSLRPILIHKPNSADTWGLEPDSECRLSSWMHANLELAVQACEDPETKESELLSSTTPPLNLAKCQQTAQHRRISDARQSVLAEVSGL